jgi:hypothetical protein
MISSPGARTDSRYPVKYALNGTVRVPSAEARTRLASRARSTGGASPIGEPVPRLPPRVAPLRISREANCGKSAASRGSRHDRVRSYRMDALCVALDETVIRRHSGKKSCYRALQQCLGEFQENVIKIVVIVDLRVRCEVDDVNHLTTVHLTDDASDCARVPRCWHDLDLRKILRLHGACAQE